MSSSALASAAIATAATSSSRLRAEEVEGRRCCWKLKLKLSFANAFRRCYWDCFGSKFKSEQEDSSSTENSSTDSSSFSSDQSSDEEEEQTSQIPSNSNFTMGAKKKELVSSKSSSKSSKQQNKRHKDSKNWQDSAEFLAHLKEFNQCLAPSQLGIRDVIGDGNCLFRSISDQLEGYEAQHHHYRTIAVDQLKLEKDFFKNFIFDKDFDEYVNEMSESTTWGGNIEIQAISHALGHNFIIHMKNLPFFVIKGKAVKGISKKTLHLAYHNENEGEEHYSSIRNLDDLTFEAPAEEVSNQKFQELQADINRQDQALRNPPKETPTSSSSAAAVAAGTGKKPYQETSANNKMNKKSNNKESKQQSKQSKNQQEKKERGQSENTLPPAEDQLLKEMVVITKSLEQLGLDELSAVSSSLSTKPESSEEEEDVKALPPPGLNKKCHCGSLKQYKKCCYNHDQQVKTNKVSSLKESKKREAIFI